jgi:two-component system sensor histidine kinase KdpD
MTKLSKYAVSLAAVGTVAASLAPFADLINHTTVALALLLVVLFIATVFGSRPALAASVFAGLGFNFLFLPPYYTFNISHQENWVALAAFLITAIVAGQLSSYARRRADESERQRVEIQKLYGDLQDAFEQASEAEALRRSEKLKSSILDAVTHDLRTPLTSIKASATTLIENKRSRLLDEEGETEFLEIINEETDRLNNFVEGMVGLARIEANAMHLRKSWNGLQEVIEMAIERAKPQLGDQTVLVRIEPSVPNMFIDAASVSEVIYTLVDNAARYSPPGSDIRITASRSSDNLVEIGVEDQGPGIAEEWREKVFEKFVRVEAPPVPSTGTGLGLGLAIARGIVESQDGHIWIEDGRGKYVTKMIFSLPIGEQQS